MSPAVGARRLAWCALSCVAVNLASLYGRRFPRTATASAGPSQHVIFVTPARFPYYTALFNDPYPSRDLCLGVALPMAPRRDAPVREALVEWRAIAPATHLRQGYSLPPTSTSPVIHSGGIMARLILGESTLRPHAIPRHHHTPGPWGYQTLPDGVNGGSPKTLPTSQISRRARDAYNGLAPRVVPPSERFFQVWNEPEPQASTMSRL
jgi:hypothetical protein